MKKIILNIAFASSILLGVSSCKKDLQQDPPGSITEANAFTSVADLEQGMLGALQYTDPTNRIYIGSVLADEVRLSSENRGQGQGIFKFQYSASEGEHNANFSRGYVVLDRLHRVLAAIDRVQPKNAGEEIRKSRVRAELLGLRGLTYYDLLIHFMPSGYDPNALAVPIILVSDVFATPGRSKVSEVVARIEADLAAARAEAALPDAPDPNDFNTRLSKAAIAGYQARLALLKRDWPAAITYSSDALTLSGKSLISGLTGFRAYWRDENDLETIWAYRNSSAPQLLWRDTNGDVFFEPSVKLKSQFNRSTDIRTAIYWGTAGTGAALDTSVVRKYPGTTAISPTVNIIKNMRVAEMYLIRAEASAENNQLVEAENDLNALRAARIIGYVPETFATKEDAVAAVINERFKELCFEGFRFFDLKRRQLPVERFDVDVLSPLWKTLPANSFRFALPIPAVEMLANPNEVQNPGY